MGERWGERVSQKGLPRAITCNASQVLWSLVRLLNCALAGQAALLDGRMASLCSSKTSQELISHALGRQDARVFLKARRVHYECILFQCDIRLQMTFTGFCTAWFSVWSHLSIRDHVQTPVLQLDLPLRWQTAYGQIKYWTWGVAKSFPCLRLKAFWTPLTGHNLTHVLMLSNNNQKNKLCVGNQLNHKLHWDSNFYLLLPHSSTLPLSQQFKNLFFFTAAIWGWATE